VVERVVEHFGRVDLLVNNAGLSQSGDALSEPITGVSGVLQVNVVAALELARLCVPHMRTAGGGRIIFVSSMLGLVGCGQTQPSYVASKGALISMTRELAAQWAPWTIRVNALAPGWFNTDLTAEMFNDAKGQRWMARATPLGRPGEAHELDGALLFLASEASSFVTGQTMVVDGGWTAV
jgi:NAD(P)-dependent dehydrogenase (short-subunit alcohol dehydrogenase family)